MHLEPGREVERYVVQSVLGEGGMAMVYRVRHTHLGTAHALKVLTLTNRDIRERLLQEGRVQASLRHPNIVAVSDVFEIDGAPALLMEYVAGPALDRWLASYRPRLHEALAVFRGIVAGVAHAHARGLIHRDLKPANVMLDVTELGLTPKVTDFGLAKALNEEALSKRTRTGATMGTPAYMAPEQIRDASSVDHRADLFSLGCILYELVCGQPPFQGPDIISLFNAVASADFAPPRERKPDLPDAVVRAIEGLLQIDPAERFGSCAAVIACLDGKRGDDDTTVVPPPMTMLIGPDGPAVDAARSLVIEPSVVLPASMGSNETYAVDGEAEPGGGTLAPATSQDPLTQSRAPSARGALLLAGGVVALLLLVSAVAAGGIGLGYLMRGPGEATAPAAEPATPTDAPPIAAPPAAEPEPEPEAEPTGEAAAEPEPEPDRPAAERPPRGKRPMPEKLRKGKAVGQTEIEAAPAPTTATIRYQGASNLWLQAKDGQRHPASQPVPAGTYEMLAWFDGPDPVNAGRLTVRAGETVAVRCEPLFARCTR